MTRTVDDALAEAGAGRFQLRLMGIFGLVWAADERVVDAACAAGAGAHSAPAKAFQYFCCAVRSSS